MGYHTLIQERGQTLAQAVAADLGAEACVRQEQAGACIVHTILATVPDAHVWIVSRVERGMVKHMDEGMGPYCPAPSPAFVAEAERLCEAPAYAAEFASGFREAMRAGQSYGSV